MVFKRTYRRKRFGAKRRPFRRRFRRTKIPRRIRSPVYFMKQTAELPNVVVSAGATKFFTYSFDISLLGNISSMVDIWDSYCINAVRVSFTPQFNVYNAATSTIALPDIYTCIDYNSAVLPISVSELNEYATCKHQVFTRTHTRYFRPKVLYNIQSSINTPATATGGRMWLSLTSTLGTTVPHYGLIGAITASQSSAIVAQLVRVTVTYYLAFKNVH